jgi:AcrR family transcriptional regulator
MPASTKRDPKTERPSARRTFAPAVREREDSRKAPQRTISDRSDPRTLSTDDWIRVAKSVLIREGIAAVKIDRIARESGVTRGGFYWRFKSRNHLLQVLLDDWRQTNTSPIIEALLGEGTPAERFDRLARLWIEERDFSPDYDDAVRNWSAIDPKVAAVVRNVDNERIDAFERLYRDYGYGSDEALVRARITYYHQVGYYALGVRESAERRRMLNPLFQEILTGFSRSDPAAMARDRKRRSTGSSKT